MKDSISNRILGKKSNKRINKKIDKLGFNFDSSLFNGARIIFSIIIFLIFFLLRYGYVLAGIVTIAYYFAFEYFLLDIPIIKKNKKIEDDVVDYFSIFILALNGGRNVKRALKITNDIVDNSLSEEFQIVLRNVSYGKSLNECLNDLKKKTDSIILNNILISLISANKLGNSVSESIQLQIDLLKEEKNHKIVNAYRFASFKMVAFCLIMSIVMVLVLFCLNILLS